MSDKDERGEKITVLFSASSEKEANSEPEEEGEASGRELLDEEESEGQEAKVVRLDFGRRPSSVVQESQELSEADLSPEDLSKLTIFRRIIEEDAMVMVTLDTRVAGVDVPPKFRGLPELRLNYSYLFNVPDFEFDARGVRASLSFQGKRYYCQVPWSAVFMLYNHDTSEVFVFEMNRPD